MDSVSRRCFLFAALLLVGHGAAAQPTDLYVTGERQPVQLSASTVFQRFDDGDRVIEEVSFPLVLQVPLGSRAGVSLMAGAAAASGDALEKLSGITDVQLGLSYRQPIGSGSLVASVGTNLPSGKRELSSEEFATSVALSQNFYNFAQPGFGQGFSVAPGLTVAYPLGEMLVVGGGVAYQYKDGYTPVTTMQGGYDPGDELIVTGGLDVRLGTTAALSGDVAYTRYGSDELGGQEFYQAGNRIAASLQYLNHLGFDTLHLYARYSSRGRGQIPVPGGGLATETHRSVPSYGRIRALYRKRTTETTYLGMLVQGRLYEETRAYSSKTLVDVGVRPELRITREVSLVSRFVYTLGSFSGLTAGMGLTAEI